MNKTILRILIASLILLMGINAVNALESNSTDDFTSFEQNNLISISNDYEDNLTVENVNDSVVSISNDAEDNLSVENRDDGVVAVSNGTDVVLSVENRDDGVVAVSNGTDVVLNVENKNSSVVAVSNDANDVLTANIKEDEKLSSWGYSPASEFTRTKTQFKTFILGKIAIPKIYLRFVNGYVPLKKNKKVWKAYVAYTKYLKKAVIKLRTYYRNLLYKLDAGHWHLFDYDIRYKTSYVGNYFVVTYYCKGYRSYNYNPLLKKYWWD